MEFKSELIENLFEIRTESTIVLQVSQTWTNAIRVNFFEGPTLTWYSVGIEGADWNKLVVEKKQGRYKAWVNSQLAFEFEATEEPKDAENANFVISATRLVMKKI